MKEKTLTLAGAIVIFVLLITTAIALISNSKNKRNFNNEKIQNESLTSQKLQDSQNLDKIKSDLKAITSKEETASKALAKAKSNLAEKEKKIASMSKENSSLINEKNELAQLKKSKSDLDKSYGDLELQHETALLLIKDLENSKITLDSDRKELMSELESSQKNRIDNIEVYASGGNNKITDIARRTKDLNLNFDTPLGKTDAMSYKIITPSGTIINPEDKTSAWVVTEVADHSPQKMTASLSNVSVVPENLRQIKLKDNSKSKLTAGEYTIQIFNNNKIVGNYRLKLR